MLNAYVVEYHIYTFNMYHRHYIYIVAPAVISLIKVGMVSECDPVQCQRSQFVETVIARGERHGAWPSGLYRIGHNGQLGPP